MKLSTEGVRLSHDLQPLPAGIMRIEEFSSIIRASAAHLDPGWHVVLLSRQRSEDGLIQANISLDIPNGLRKLDDHQINQIKSLLGDDTQPPPAEDNDGGEDDLEPEEVEKAFEISLEEDEEHNVMSSNVEIANNLIHIPDSDEAGCWETDVEGHALVDLGPAGDGADESGSGDDGGGHKEDEVASMLSKLTLEPVPAASSTLHCKTCHILEGEALEFHQAYMHQLDNAFTVYGEKMSVRRAGPNLPIVCPAPGCVCKFFDARHLDRHINDCHTNLPSGGSSACPARSQPTGASAPDTIRRVTRATTRGTTHRDIEGGTSQLTEYSSNSEKGLEGEHVSNSKSVPEDDDDNISGDGCMAGDTEDAGPNDIVSSSSPEDCSEKLVATSTMARSHLLFNTKYSLIICSICQWGVPLDYVYTHITADDQMTYGCDPKSACWRRELVIPHGTSVDGRRPRKPDAALGKKLRDKITEELLADYGIDPGTIRTVSSAPSRKISDWRENAWPANDQSGPIQGLQAFEGKWWVCYDCPRNRRQAYATKKTLSNHRSAHHPGDRGRDIHDSTLPSGSVVQSLTLVRGLDLFFVLPASDTPMHPDGPSARGVADLLFDQKKLLLGSLPERSKDRKLVIPFLLQSGADDFLGKFDREEILALRTLPDLRRRHLVALPLKRLLLLVRSTFWADSDKAGLMDQSIQMAISDCNINRSFSSRKFVPIGPEGKRAEYAAVELQFIWMNLMHTQKPVVECSGSGSLFTHDQNQQESLKKLWTCLNSKPFDRADTEKALYDSFSALYFPKNNMASAIKKHHAPVWVFLAISCLSPMRGGGYVDPALVPPIISKVQYSIRLKSSHKIHLSLLARLEAIRTSTRGGSEQPGGKTSLDPGKPAEELDISESDPWFRDTLLPFCNQYLRENNLSPFASVRVWMHEFTKLVKKTPRPQTVDWIEPDVMTLAGDRIDFKAYKSYLHRQLESLEKHVQDKVLFGLDLDLLGVRYKPSSFQDTCDYSTPNYGPLSDPDSDLLRNVDSDKFFEAMVESKCLGLRTAHDGQLLWDRSKTLPWIGDVHQAWLLLYPLCHTTEGLPGRGTEETNFGPVNTDVSRTHLSLASGTIGFNSNYHKGSVTTGMYKSILRLIPERVAIILIILLRVVRPIELGALLKFVVAQDKCAEVEAAYRSRVWASYGNQWKSSDASEALRIFFLEGLGVELMLRRYRHFATALQQHYLPYTRDNKTELLAAACLMAGHTEETIDANYAILVGKGLTPARITELYKRIAQDWHRLLDFETSSQVK